MKVAAARTLLMGGLGLLDDPRRPATKAALRKTIESMGYVQVDTINAVERAHHHILMTRLDGYRHRLLSDLLEKDRTLFEHWTHDAAILPAAFIPQWRHQFDRWAAWSKRTNVRARLGDSPKKVLAHVRERVAREGPLMSRDFQDARKTRRGTWWDWKPQKTALECLWRTGELAVSGRRNFEKLYDLWDRTYTAHPRSDPPADDHTDWLFRESIARLGVATPAELAAFFDTDIAPARRWCERAEASGELVPVAVDSATGSPARAAYARHDWQRVVDGALPPPRRTRLVSPFDPVIRDRERVQRVFGFDYTLEVFVPARKRRYGYYVLPILEGGRFVGRLDPKFERDRGVLAVRHIWWEPGVAATPTRHRGLERAVARLAEQIGADGIELPVQR